jgi:hypothetical protein
MSYRLLERLKAQLGFTYIGLKSHLGYLNQLSEIAGSSILVFIL